jgi:hypothetical protein
MPSNLTVPRRSATRSATVIGVRITLSIFFSQLCPFDASPAGFFALFETHCSGYFLQGICGCHDNSKQHELDVMADANNPGGVSIACPTIAWISFDQNCGSIAETTTNAGTKRYNRREYLRLSCGCNRF